MRLSINPNITLNFFIWSWKQDREIVDGSPRSKVNVKLAIFEIHSCIVLPLGVQDYPAVHQTPGYCSYKGVGAVVQQGLCKHLMHLPTYDLEYLRGQNHEDKVGGMSWMAPVQSWPIRMSIFIPFFIQLARMDWIIQSGKVQKPAE